MSCLSLDWFFSLELHLKAELPDNNHGKTIRVNLIDFQQTTFYVDLQLGWTRKHDLCHNQITKLYERWNKPFLCWQETRTRTWTRKPDLWHIQSRSQNSMKGEINLFCLDIAPIAVFVFAFLFVFVFETNLFCFDSAPIALCSLLSLFRQRCPSTLGSQLNYDLMTMILIPKQI